jgi:two-component system chemotaxis response regulator CheB
MVCVVRDSTRVQPGEVSLPLVLIGGSAGAIQPLRRIVAGLPGDLDAAVCVVVHMPDDSASALARLFAQVGSLDASFARHGEPLAPRTIRVAPPGSHLLVQDGHLVLSEGARENRTRPAIDPLFRSAAGDAGPRVVSVVLSGTLDDGAAGSAAVARAGGVAIVQDPADAEFPDMPRNAIATGDVGFVLPASAIAAKIGEMVVGLARGGSGVAPSPTSARAASAPASAGEIPDAPPFDPSGDHPHGNPREDPVDRGILGVAEDLSGPGSPFSCPACGGVLYEREPPEQYLCRLGHRYSPETLAKSQLETVEDALWTALRTLEESASLAERVRDRAAARGDPAMELRFEARREGAQARADRIRALLRGQRGSDEDEIEDEAERTA